jgi:hypothetical protein
MPNRNLHILGLGIGANLLGLGVFAGLYPNQAAYGVFGVPRSYGKEISGDLDSHETGAARMTQLLAARDVAIAGAILSYGFNGNDEAMGELILWSVIFGAVDSVVTWRYQGPW